MQVCMYWGFNVICYTNLIMDEIWMSSSKKLRTLPQSTQIKIYPNPVLHKPITAEYYISIKIPHNEEIMRSGQISYSNVQTRELIHL